MKITKALFFLCFLLLTACTVDNLDDLGNTPKTDFSTYDFVMATEDSSDVDITTFFAFNWDEPHPDTVYDLINASPIFVNSNPSISSGFYSMGSYFFSMAKDKKGYSSTPGLYRMTLNEENRTFIESELHISKDNLFPARQLSIVNEHLGYFYDEGKDAYSIQYFDPTAMQLLGSIDLKDAIQAFRPDARWTDDFGNNLVRTGTLALDAVGGKLYVSIVFLEAAEFNLIPEDDNHFYLAVIDIATQEFEKIISYPDVQTVGFFVSENKATAADENGNMYFCSWGWNQFNSHRPSKVFRIKNGETEFDPGWAIDIENLFGPMRIAQSIISFNGKIYLHISEQPYGFSDDDPETIQMGYYEFDPKFPDEPKKLDIPDSNPSSRINVFSIIDEKLYMAVPNLQSGLFNGFYSIDKDGFIQKEISIAHKYSPTRLYRLKGQ